MKYVKVDSACEGRKYCRRLRSLCGRQLAFGYLNTEWPPRVRSSRGSLDFNFRRRAKKKLEMGFEVPVERLTLARVRARRARACGDRPSSPAA